MATRRNLMTGASAALATLAASGPGVAAGAGLTTLAGAAPAPHPDAELIRLCTEFDAIERRHYAVFAAMADREEDAAEAAMKAMAEEHEPVLDQITALSPTTIEGAIALAATLHNWTRGDFADDETTDERLARALVEGLAKLSPSAGLLRFKHANSERA